MMKRPKLGFKIMLLWQSIFIITPIIQPVHSAVVYNNKMRETEYDYIIVGGGTAGSVLANRLSEESSFKVLLLEAGYAARGISEIPIHALSLMGTEMDWQYVTEPQKKACLAYPEQRCTTPRGKVLGGTSTINGMHYVRGEKRDFDEWAKGGATKWSWDDVLYYFKKSEDQTSSDLSKTGLYGVGGPQTVSVLEYATPLRGAYFKAMEHLGYSMVDINSGSPMGYSKVQVTTRDGLRCSTEKAYLRPAATRENLDILTGAHVIKIQFDKDKRADSVRFEQDSVTHVVKARKEIILAAGVYGSPQILLLSGIGPRKHLEELKIPVVADLPVGENLQDHFTANTMTYVLNKNVSLVLSRILNYESLSLLMEGSGPLSIPAGVECLGVINSKYQKASENWPDLRVFFLSTLLKLSPDKKFRELFDELDDKDAFSIVPIVARPKSRGYLRLRSTDPYEHPLINPMYLSHEEDLETIIEGMKFVEKLAQTPALQEFGATRFLQEVPGCENLDPKEDDYWKCMASLLTQSTFHQCCTCKMGDRKDTTTVVDPELRVKGVSGLRVADASIMPVVTSGNTMAPCIMIGEKAADLIKGRYWDGKLNKLVEITK